MCWVSTEINATPQVCVAKEDMVVYKVLRKSGLSPFLRHFYVYGELAEKIDVVPNRFNEINEGYHSYSRPPKCYNNLYVIMGDENNISNVFKTIDFNIHKAIIPKGTKYYENYWGEVVSETIIVTNEIVDVNELVKK